MDFVTLTADQFASLVADGLAMLPLEDESSSSSDSSVSSWSSSSSSSEEFSSSSSSSSEEISSSSDFLDPMPTNINRTVPPQFWLTGGGHLHGASFGIMTSVDQSLFRTTAVPMIRYPTALHLVSPYSNSEIRFTLNGKNPTNTSYLYTEPLVFVQNMSGTDNTVVKARIYSRSNSNVKSKIIRLKFRVLPVP